MPIEQTASRQQHRMADVLQRIPGQPEVRYTAFMLVALATLALTAWSATVFAPGAPVLGLEAVGRGYVYQRPEGPAREAGLQVGDRIIGIEGVPLRERFRTAGEARAGDHLSVTYEREGIVNEVRLELAPLEGQERTLTFERLILAVLFWLSATGVWLLRPGELAARRFFVFSHLMTAFLSVETLDLLFAPAVVASDVLRLFVVPTLATFLVLFPTPLERPWSLRLPAAAYGLATLLLVTYAAHLIAPLESLSSLAFWRIARAVDVAILVTALVVLLLPRRIRSLAALHKRRAILFGIVVGMLPTLVLTMMAWVVLGEPILEYVWTFPTVAFIPLSFAAAAYAGELGKLDWFINRSLVYVFLTTVLFAAYGAAFFVLSRYLTTGPAWAFALSGTAIAITAGALFQPFRTRLQRRVDRLFYGGWYDYRTFIESATSDLSRVDDQETLLERLHAACMAMRRHEFAILMPRQDRFEVVRELGLPEAQNRTFVATNGLLAEQLRRIAAPVSSGDLRVPGVSGDFISVDAVALATFHAHRWIPMVSKDTLRGIILVREDDEHELPPEDLAILATLSRQAAVACENLALLDSLRERLTQVQHMNDELREIRFRLGEGREQERLHLARELHDGPVQDLYAVMHRVESLEDPDATHSREAVAVLRAELAGVADTLRQICSELRPPLLTDFGLEAAVRELVGEFQEDHPDLRVSLQVATGDRDVPEPVRSALYRICQEALRNVAQHADATGVMVRLEADVEQTVLRIRDDGRGFNVPDKLIELGRQGHLGLLGIGERAEAVGGSLTVESRPSHGTVIRVVVPTNASAEADASSESNAS